MEARRFFLRSAELAVFGFVCDTLSRLRNLRCDNRLMAAILRKIQPSLLDDERAEVGADNWSAFVDGAAAEIGIGYMLA